jgi:hypothetical protein
MPQIDQRLDELENVFSGGLKAGIFGTLVKSVYNDVGGVFSSALKHVFETLRKRSISWLSRSGSVCRIQARENFVARVRLGGELNKERGKEAPAMLFLSVTKIEIVIGDRS